MKGDFSRLTFRPGQHFSQVLLQQGRVLVDADFNEQGAIAKQAVRRLTWDLLGRHAGPVNELGFRIRANGGRITIDYGRYYVNGVAGVHTAPPPDDTGSIASSTFFDEQVGYPFDNSVEASKMVVGTQYFFYLDLWERPVTWFEDELLREVALNGPDTALRAQVVWRVRGVAVEAAVTAEWNGGSKLPDQWLDHNIQRHFMTVPPLNAMLMPQMKAWTDPKDNPDDTPCVADPLGGFSGLENQFYRVEIHSGVNASGPVTFKWSRDNGSVVAAWSGMDGNDIVVSGVHDTAHGFSVGQWIELTDEIWQLNQQPGVMVRLTNVEQDRLSFDPKTASGAVPVMSSLKNPVVRRWDHRESKAYDLNGGAIVLKEDSPFALERGIHVSFRPPNDGHARYLSGDCWLIPARTAVGDIEWPFHIEVMGGKSQIVRDFAEPYGVHHVYAPLAIVTPTASNAFDIKPLQRTINQLWTKL